MARDNYSYQKYQRELKKKKKKEEKMQRKLDKKNSKLAGDQGEVPVNNEVSLDQGVQGP